VTPAVTRPDRAGDERQRTEDHALVDRDVALEIGVVVPLPQNPERLPSAPGKAGVRRQGDADVEVEDLLVQAVGVHGGVEEDERDRRDDQRKGEQGERREAVIP